MVVSDPRETLIVTVPNPWFSCTQTDPAFLSHAYSHVRRWFARTCAHARGHARHLQGSHAYRACISGGKRRLREWGDPSLPGCHPACPGSSGGCNSWTGSQEARDGSEPPQAGPAEPWIRGQQVPRLLLQHEPGGGEPAEGQLCSPHFTWVPPVLLHPPETVRCPVSTLRDGVSSVQGDGRPHQVCLSP